MRKLDSFVAWFRCQHISQYAVIWRDKAVITRSSSDQTALGSDTGINDYQKNCTRRKIGVSRHQSQSSLANILRLDSVRDVDEIHSRANTAHHRLHHTDIGIAQAKIRKQSNRSCHDRLL